MTSQDNALNEIFNDIANACQVQSAVLKEILDLQKDTEYGKKYDFANIKTIKQFQDKHPLTDYEHYYEIIEKISRTGDYKKLVSEPIVIFLESSGTTGKSKILLSTKTLSSKSGKIEQAGTALCRKTYFQNRINKDASRGLNLANASYLKTTPSGIPQGNAFSLALRNAPLPAQKNITKLFTSPFPIFLISDFRVSFYCHLLFALIEPNLAYISSNYVSSIWELMQILEKEWKNLIQDIESGEINENLNLDVSIQEELSKILKPDFERAELLKKEFKKGFKDIFPRIWPNLTYIKCITSGSMEIYVNNLKKYIGKIPLCSTNYGASESWCGINLDLKNSKPLYTITPHTAFFEFIPISEMEAKNPITVDLTSLKVNESYELVITTFTGLYRYRLGDIVKCVKYNFKSPVVKYLYRKGSLLNIDAEKVSEIEIFTAIHNSLKVFENSTQIVDYTTSICLKSFPHKYILYIELSKNIKSELEINRYRDEIDKTLLSLNILYRKKRTESNIIDKPEIKLTKTGSFKALKEKILATKGAEPQFKMPRLLKEEDLISYIENFLLN
ncbi:MAG: GH3 auxin-responsive promoter family protein [Prochloraceae cyanobacterium]